MKYTSRCQTIKNFLKVMMRWTSSSWGLYQASHTPSKRIFTVTAEQRLEESSGSDCGLIQQKPFTTTVFCGTPIILCMLSISISISSQYFLTVLATDLIHYIKYSSVLSNSSALSAQYCYNTSQFSDPKLILYPALS